MTGWQSMVTMLFERGCTLKATFAASLQPMADVAYKPSGGTYVINSLVSNMQWLGL